MQEKKHVYRSKQKRQRRNSRTSFPVFFAAVFAIIGGILFFLYASACKSYLIALSNRIVTAEYVDIEEGYAVGDVSLAAKSYTLVYSFVDTDGTVYRKANSTRRYDRKEMALAHLGETIKIRIDGKGNHMENLTSDFRYKELWLVFGIVSVLLALFMVIIRLTALGENIGAFFSRVGCCIAGEKRPARSILLAALFVVLLVSALSLGLSGLSGNAQIRYWDRLTENRIVEATYTRISEMHAGRASSDTYYLEYEYVDHENGDMVYRGKCHPFDYIRNVPEMREKFVGKTVRIHIDGMGGSLVVGSAYGKTIRAYQWAGLGLGIAAVIVFIAYFPVRNKATGEKQKPR